MNKKYKDMRQSCVKITYNSMGERVQTKMRFSKKQKVSREKCKSCKQHPISTFRKDQPVNETDPMSSSTLIWAVDILRDVLFGKIFRDVLAPSTMKTMELHDILRFFFQSSFGATEIAIKRQMDLFQTILVHQQYSAFFRVAKRLVGIPGIQMFHPTVSAIYLEVWAWLFRENALQSMDCGRTVIVERNTLLEALEAVMFSGGNSFPLKLRSAIRGEIEKHENDCIDLDYVLENILKSIEELDGSSRKVEEAIFKKKHMVSVAHSQSNMDGQSSIAVSTLKLAHLKKLFEMVVYLDSTRIGLLTVEKVTTLLLSWFQDCWNIVDLEETELTRLLQHFEYEDNEKAIDYVLLLGVMYTFVLDCIDEDPLPHVLEAYLEEYRGTDEEDIDDIVKYVDGVRLKLDKSQLSMRATTNECVVNARRAMSTLRPFPSNFISRWIMKPERDVFEQEEMRKPQVQVMKKVQYSLQKPVLHCKDAELNVQAVHLKEDISESSCGDQATGQHSLVKNPFGKSIYIRFPGVEPYRRPLNCQKRPNDSIIKRKASITAKILSSAPVKDDVAQTCDLQISNLRSRCRTVEEESSGFLAQEKNNLTVDPVQKSLPVGPIKKSVEDFRSCSLVEKAVNDRHDEVNTSNSNLVQHEKPFLEIKCSEKREAFSINAKEERLRSLSNEYTSRKPASQEPVVFVVKNIPPKSSDSQSIEKGKDFPHLIAQTLEEKEICFSSFAQNDQSESISNIGASDSSDAIDMEVQTLPDVADASDPDCSILIGDDVQAIVENHDSDFLEREIFTVDEICEQNLENIMLAPTTVTSQSATTDIVVNFEESKIAISKVVEDSSTTLLVSPKYSILQQQAEIQNFMKMLSSSSICHFGGRRDIIRQNNYFQIHLDRLEVSRTLMYFVSIFRQQQKARKALAAKMQKYETDQVKIVPVTSEVHFADQENTSLVENKDMVADDSKSKFGMIEKVQFANLPRDDRPMQTERKCEHGRLETLDYMPEDSHLFTQNMVLSKLNNTFDWQSIFRMSEEEISKITSKPQIDEARNELLAFMIKRRNSRIETTNRPTSSRTSIRMTRHKADSVNTRPASRGYLRPISPVSQLQHRKIKCVKYKIR